MDRTLIRGWASNPRQPRTWVLSPHSCGSLDGAMLYTQKVGACYMQQAKKQESNGNSVKSSDWPFKLGGGTWVSLSVSFLQRSRCMLVPQHCPLANVAGSGALIAIGRSCCSSHSPHASGPLDLCRFAMARLCAKIADFGGCAMADAESQSPAARKANSRSLGVAPSEIWVFFRVVALFEVQDLEWDNSVQRVEGGQTSSNANPLYDLNFPIGDFSLKHADWRSDRKKTH